MTYEPNFYLIPNTKENIKCALIYQKDTDLFKKNLHNFGIKNNKLNKIDRNYKLSVN